ncbi:FUSC family protein [Streptomyces sp. MUM 16J]|uniref:FUSC family protein n=1 Tax=Streptomyces sp. MUM 16J TaxID=2791988 RepID=UPI001F033FB9|nr:FUSC family protein [Streptomyces sp. MUM 16J]
MGSETDTGGAARVLRSVPPLRRTVSALRFGTSASACAGRRAVRITIPAVAVFSLSLYGLHQPVTATYGLFAAVAMAGLSRIPGTGRQRAAVIIRVLPVGWLLVTAGTLLAVRTWTAVAGMLVIGFLLSYSAVAGPRLAGAAPGLQLMYILPCFPPFEPQTLPERLGGMTLGVLLLVLCESLLLPDPPTTSYRDLSADAAMTSARCATELTHPPWTLATATAAAAREAGDALRPLRVSEAERPAGPGLREQALAHAGMASRVLLARLREVPGPGPQGPHPHSLALLREVATTARKTAAALRTGRPAAGADHLGEALAAYRLHRTVPANGTESESTDAVMRRQAILLETAFAGVTLATAADLALGGRPTADRTQDAGFWYARHSDAWLWGNRMLDHLSPHSVYFQNAVRISLALAAARTVAGLGSLPHGFWTMLAVLTLVRTTAAQTGSTVAKALTGTLLGALVAAVVLLLVRGNTAAYAVALPVIMLAAFWIGPTHGVGWGQALFTLVVSIVFAQLAPATWHLAELRFLDVFTGSMIGLAFGVLAWPHGAQRELRRDVAALLRAIAETIASTTAVLTRVRAPEPSGLPSLRHALTLAESSFAQYQSEPRRPGTTPVDWHAALIAGHHAIRGSRRLLQAQDPAEVHSFPPGWRAGLAGDGDALAERYQLTSTLLEGARQTVPQAPQPALGGASADRPPGASAPPVYYDAEAWLRALAVDLRHISDTVADATDEAPDEPSRTARR